MSNSRATHHQHLFYPVEVPNPLEQFENSWSKSVLLGITCLRDKSSPARTQQKSKGKGRITPTRWPDKDLTIHPILSLTRGAKRRWNSELEGESGMRISNKQTEVGREAEPAGCQGPWSVVSRGGATGTEMGTRASSGTIPSAPALQVAHKHDAIRVATINSPVLQ